MLSDILGTLPDSDDDAPQTRAKPRRVTGSADKKRKLGELSGAVSEDLTHCPVCMDWHRGDIFQCPEGHLLCGPCKAGLQNDACPSCRSPLGSIRARAVEKMLQAVMMPCRWHENGCTETGTSAARTKHEAACKFKRYTCPAKGCTHTCGADEMVDHVVNAHLAGKTVDHIDGLTRIALDADGIWGPYEVNYVLIFRRKKRGLFIICVDVSAGRVLLKARTLFDLDGYKYMRVALAVQETRRGVSVPLPLTQADDWEFSLRPQAKDASVVSFPASMFSHMKRDKDDVAKGEFWYWSEFELVS